MITAENREAKTKQETEWRPMANGGFIRAVYGFQYIPGNRKPYFSITGDIAERASVHNRGETKAEGSGLPDTIHRITGGGCCHDSILEYFPELAKLIPWHLASDDGLPMHYQENGLHHMRCYLGIYRVMPHMPIEPVDPKGMPFFKSTIVFGALASDDKRLRECLSVRAQGAEKDKEAPTVIDVVCGDTEDTEADERSILGAVREWLPQRRELLHAAMDQSMKRFYVERIQVKAYLAQFPHE